LADVFISYSRTDKRVAERLAASLDAFGVSHWMDSHLAGGSTFTEVTEAELNEAGKVIVLWSEASIKSDWVKDEAQAGREQGKLIPLAIDGSQPPMGFRQIQTIDLAGWAKGKEADLPPALLHALALAGTPRAAPAPPAPKPRRKIGLITLAAALIALLAAGYWLWHGGFDGQPSDRHIAVLVRAFAPSGTGDVTEKALASGITDELIVRLRRIKELEVATAEPDGSPPSAAFKQAYVVDGNIRSDGDQLQVAARLTRPDGEILWSDTDDRKMSDLLALQEQIATSIANALSVSFDVGTNSTRYGGTDNPEAYAAYMQYQSNSMNRDANVPLQYLNHALALDPHYVKALTELASYYGIQASGHGGYSTVPKQQALDLLAKMDKVTAQAVALDPDLAIVHVSRGEYYFNVRDLTAADREMRRAAELDPGDDPELRSRIAGYEVSVGRAGKALSLIQSAAVIDPIYEDSPAQMRPFLYLGRYRETIDLFGKFAAVTGDVQRLDTYPFWAHMMLGGEDEGLRFSDQEHAPYGARLRAFKADTALPTMTSSELEKWAAKQYGESGQFQPTNTAMFASYYGHPRLAVDLLRIAFERPGGEWLGLLWHPALANARKTPEFAQLVTDLGFVKMWRDSGDWGDFCSPKEGGTISCQ
jgi:TolB-like protein